MHTDDYPSLLLASAGALMAVVAAVWLLAETNAGWAVVIAVATAMTGAAGLLLFIGQQLQDDDENDDAPTPAEARAAEH